jgi:hypothetical protein
MHFRYILLLFVFLFVGCQQQPKANPEFRLVKGTVTFNGAAVEGATIAFLPTDGGGLAAGGMTDASGNYTLTADNSLVAGAGTKSGKYKVTVKKIEMPVNQDQLDFESGKITQDELMKRQMTYKPVRPKNLLPEIYADPQTTPLELTVADQKENVLDVKVEGK